MPELRRQLLAWWDVHGRHTIPWKLHPDGSRPADGEALDPYGVFVAEVMRAARQHSRVWAGRVWIRQLGSAVLQRCVGSCRAEVSGEGQVGCALLAIRAILRTEVFP